MYSQTCIKHFCVSVHSWPSLPMVSGSRIQPISDWKQSYILLTLTFSLCPKWYNVAIQCNKFMSYWYSVTATQCNHFLFWRIQSYNCTRYCQSPSHNVKCMGESTRIICKYYTILYEGCRHPRISVSTRSPRTHPLEISSPDCSPNFWRKRYILGVLKNFYW